MPEVEITRQGHSPPAAEKSGGVRKQSCSASRIDVRWKYLSTFHKRNDHSCCSGGLRGFSRHKPSTPGFVHRNPRLWCQRPTKAFESTTNYACKCDLAHSRYAAHSHHIVFSLILDQHFELVSAHSLQQAQAALLAEIEPEVASLLNRVSVHLDRLERREQSLIAKCDLNEGRLSHERERARGSTPKPTSDDLRPEAIPVEEIKIQRLRQKKERLSYAVDRLTLQAHQRERQLRMSMAAPQQYGLD